MKVQCSSCGKPTEHTQRGSSSESEEVEVLNGQRYPVEWTLLLLQCNGCGSSSLYVNGEMDEGLKQLYPHEKDLTAVPEYIRSKYQQAKKIINISPEGFCVLGRSALEAVCNDREAEGANLFLKLQNLYDRGIIPETLLQMGHQVRIVGNVVVHLGEFRPSIQDAWVVDDFFLTLVEYVYIIPGQLDKLAQRIKDASQ